MYDVFTTSVRIFLQYVEGNRGGGVEKDTPLRLGRGFSKVIKTFEKNLCPDF